MRSSWEKHCWEKLTDAGIPFKYEPFKFVLQEKFSRTSKENNKIIKVVRPITYKPDFVGDGWVIEVKGLLRQESQLRWKMFKRLYKPEEDIKFYMAKSLKQIDEIVNEIKESQDKHIALTKNTHPKSNKRLIRGGGSI